MDMLPSMCDVVSCIIAEQGQRIHLIVEGFQIFTRHPSAAEDLKVKIYIGTDKN
jgi:hypothetical protein